MPTSTVTGQIAVVQEQRFRLVADDGRVLLLTLGRRAKLDGVDLERLHRLGARVRIEYEGQPNLESGVATSVTEVTAGKRAA